MRFALAIAMLFFVGTNLLSGCAQAQQEAQLAGVDSSNAATVGEVVTIRSQFAELPLVEPHLSAHPTDKNVLLAAAMVVTDIDRPYESCRLSSFYSSDAGATWLETAHDYWGYDPWTAISPSGDTAMTWLGTAQRFQGRFPINFFSSPDAGATWDEHVQVGGGAHDGTKIASYGNEFYFTSVRFVNHGANVVLYRREGDQAFEEVAVIDGQGERLNFCEPAVLTDGKVLVPASHYLQTAWVQVYDHSSGDLSQKYPITNQPGGGRGYMRMVADANAESPFKDRVYFLRALSGEADGVWMNSSSDAGKTWSEDRRIDLFTDGVQRKAIVPSAAVNSAGVLGVSWVVRRDEPLSNDVYFTHSIDGGQTFARPVRVTRVSSNPRTEKNGDVANKFPGGGHYLGIAARADGCFQLIWSDSRSGHFELQTVSVKVDAK